MMKKICVKSMHAKMFALKLTDKQRFCCQAMIVVPQRKCQSSYEGSSIGLTWRVYILEITPDEKSVWKLGLIFLRLQFKVDLAGLSPVS